MDLNCSMGVFTTRSGGLTAVIKAGGGGPGGAAIAGGGRGRVLFFAIGAACGGGRGFVSGSNSVNVSSFSRRIFFFFLQFR